MRAFLFPLTRVFIPTVRSHTIIKKLIKGLRKDIIHRYLNLAYLAIVKFVFLKIKNSYTAIGRN